jgi:flagellar basal body-associated protein FliL
MENKEETERKTRRPSVQSIILLLILVISIVVVGWVLAVVSTTSQVPPSDFVALPTTALSTQGSKVVFVSVSGVSRGNLLVGVEGYLRTSTGTPVTGAQVYMTYYLQGSYRTQVATTDQNGHFQALFPMNWTGWLSITLTYLGDNQHQGLTQPFSLPGEPPY